MPFTALFDACVLYPAPLRDLLLSLAGTQRFRARWTERIHDEWVGALLREKPDLADRIARTRQLVNQAVPDCLVTGWERLEPLVELPDPNDRHVLAAAITGRADVIVTFNLKDFPADRLAPWRVKAQHPDEFVRHLLDLDSPAMLLAIRAQRARLKNPTISPDDYLDTLARQQMPETVAFLRERRDFL